MFIMSLPPTMLIQHSKAVCVMMSLTSLSSNQNELVLIPLALQKLLQILAGGPVAALPIMIKLSTIMDRVIVKLVDNEHTFSQ